MRTVPSLPADKSADRRAPFATHGYRNSEITEPADEVFKIRAGSRKAALVHLGLAAWREHLFDTKDLAEPRGRKVDEAGLQRTLYRSSVGEI